MSRHKFIDYYAYAVVGTALLITAYTGSLWGMSILGLLFVFVLFPRWRTKMYKLAWRLSRGHNDSCNPDK